MRLTCPNCSARYEVADSMVPPEGRDVQCSNCSTTWFQPGRRTDRPTAVAVDRSARDAYPEPGEPPAPPASEPAAPERAAPETAAEEAAAPDTVASEPASAAPEAPQQPQPQPQRRTLDPVLRSILEEEAAREARLRRAEADPVETQGEMPLGQEPEDAHRARRRAELEGARDAFEDPEGADEAKTSAQSSRTLFPDIDEINSTLRDTGDRSGSEADATDIDTLDALPRRRRGVRIGFFAVLLIAAGAAAVYTNAGRITAAVPALTPTLDGYVDAVNGARYWLDDLAQGLASDTPEG